MGAVAHLRYGEEYVGDRIDARVEADVLRDVQRLHAAVESRDDRFDIQRALRET